MESAPTGANHLPAFAFIGPPKAKDLPANEIAGSKRETEKEKSAYSRLYDKLPSKRKASALALDATCMQPKLKVLAMEASAGVHCGPALEGGALN